jgi:membrane associated rhomboid family serine protease
MKHPHDLCQGNSFLRNVVYGGQQSGIAVWAHIGGFIAGALLIFLFRNPRRAYEARGW